MGRKQPTTVDGRWNADKFAEYSLRSSFFLRHLRAIDLWSAIADVQRIVKAKNGFAWTERGTWGIEDDAWELSHRLGIESLLLFCHPRVIQQHPRLLLYYRTVALLSRKGLEQILSTNLAKVEAGKVAELSSDQAARFAVAINRVVSAMLMAGTEIEPAHLIGMQFAASGATIQGAWNNAIGEKGEAAVRAILVNHLRDEIVHVVWKDRTMLDYSADVHAVLLDRVADIRILRLKQGYQLHFSSEPDVSLHDPAGLPVLAIEIKAGNDKAGALERLGSRSKFIPPHTLRSCGLCRQPLSAVGVKVSS